MYREHFHFLEFFHQQTSLSDNGGTTKRLYVISKFIVINMLSGNPMFSKESM